MLLRTAWLGFAGALAGCGVVVIDAPSGGTSSSNGASGGGGAGSTTTTTTTASSGAGGECEPLTCGPSTPTSCSCDQNCGHDVDLRVDCSPSGEKIECVCSYGKEFSGICFETDPSKLCDFTEGCCATYFSGK